MTKPLHTSSLSSPSALLTIQRDLAEDLEFRHMMCTVEPTVPAWPLAFVRWGLGLMHRSGPERSPMSLQAISSTAPKPLENFCPSAVGTTPFSLTNDGLPHSKVIITVLLQTLIGGYQLSPLFFCCISNFDLIESHHTLQPSLCLNNMYVMRVEEACGLGGGKRASD